MYEVMKFLNVFLGAVSIPLGYYTAFVLGAWSENKSKKRFTWFLWLLALCIVLYFADSYIWYWTMEVLNK